MGDVKKAILIIGLVLVIVSLLSGCIEEATWTMRGKVTNVEKYSDGDKSILVISFNNDSKKGIQI